MPIEIKELHIRVAVNAPPPGGGPGGAGQDAPGAAQGTAGEAEKDAIVAECVEQVLQILKNRAER